MIQRGSADGLSRLLGILLEELRVTMALCGRATVDAIGADSIALESPLAAFARRMC